MPTKKAKKKKGAASKAKKKKGAAAGKSTASRARTSKNGKKSSKARSSAKAPAQAKAAAKDKKPPESAARRAPPQDKRQLVQERKILRSQSRWLQKALFALAKAEDDQAKLAEVRGDRHEPMAVTIDGTAHQVGDVTDSLRVSVMDRLEGLRVTLRNEHALMG